MKVSKMFKLCWLLLLTTMFAASPVCAAEDAKPRLAILPFTLNASDDLGYLKEGVRTMLASRIAARSGVQVVGGAEVSKAVSGVARPDLKGVAGDLAADMVLTGSITVLGPSVSIDASLFIIKGDISKSFFAAAENQAMLIGSIDKLAEEVSAVISGEGRPPVPAEQTVSEPKPSAEPVPDAKDQSSHPDRMFKSVIAVPAPVPVPEEIPVPVPAETLPAAGLTNNRIAAPVPVSSTTRSQFLDMEIQVIDVGDVFGDGNEHIVVAEKQKITVFSLKDNQLLKLIELPEAPHYVRIIALDLADLNKNGRAEIYISAISDNTPYSYAVEWGGQDFAKLFDRQEHYLRPILVPGKGWGLYGQKADSDGPVKPGIYRADPRTGALKTDERLDVPDSVNLYEFVLGDFTGDGLIETAVQTQEDDLLLYNNTGDVLWRGSANYGYTKRFIGKSYAGSGTGNNLQIQTRLVTKDLNGDGRLELVAMENPSGVATLLKTVGSFVGGSIKVMTWNGVTLTDLWTTGEIGSYVASYQVENGRLYIGMINKKTGGLFNGLQSFVASYSLAEIGHSGS